MNIFSLTPERVLGFYCVLVLLASLAGGWFSLMVHLTHARLQILVSFVAGLMLGMALLHMIPHANFQLESLDRTVSWVLGGFLAMFFLQRFFSFHHHDVPTRAPEGPCAHDHHSHTLAEKSAGQLSWTGTLIGLSLHSLLDGIALLVAFGTALAITLHKPFDSIAITTLMTKGGCSRGLRHALNVVFALIAPLGVLLFYFGASHFAGENRLFVGCSLAFCGGMFLCISCSDLLPELQFHSHDRLKLSLALGGGLAIAILVGQFETSGHDHSAKEAVSNVSSQPVADPGH